MTPPASLCRSITRLHSLPLTADLPTVIISLLIKPGLPSPGLESPHASSPRNSTRYWNINQFPIDYAFRPRLRGRLTLSRRPLLRNPWAFGGEESHLSFRYSYLHSHFSYLQHALQHTFIGLENVHLPIITDSVASVLCLAPLHYQRIATRPVSYYALFKGMAASKPTSWLSSPLHFLSH